jgi:hypothetical protein
MDDIKWIFKRNDCKTEGHNIDLNEENVHDKDSENAESMLYKPFEISIRHFLNCLRFIR